MSAFVSGVKRAHGCERQVGVENPYLSTLPPGSMPYPEFASKFALGATSTEKLNPITLSLSQTMHKNVAEGLGLLLDVDEKVVEGLSQFIPTIDTLAPQLAEKLKLGGRIFLVGAGSSGRVGVDIAAKCRAAFSTYGEQVRGIMAGGDSAVIKAKEGCEDSEKAGEDALAGYDLGPNDTVILISASGSATFNVGCGHMAANCGANVLYFYNSESIPSRTQSLFDRESNPAVPLCIDIGPQAISGSTRLQGATLAEAGLGALLASALYSSEGTESLYPIELLDKMKHGINLIRKQLETIGQFAQREAEVFSDPRSNFREVRDRTDQGYVTFAARKYAREVVTDTVETPPTFSTTFIRREDEPSKKRPDFSAFYAGEKENIRAWEAMMGRDLHPSDAEDAQAFLLASGAEGFNRPIGKGNFVIGVDKCDGDLPLAVEIADLLRTAKEQGGYTGFIGICRGELAQEQKEALESSYNHVLILEDIPDDPLGLMETLVLKQVLNLISNGSMILMHKVHGNLMIDVQASNNKLIDRCTRLIKKIAFEHQLECTLSDQDLYHYVAHVSAIKKACASDKYTPPIIKMVLAMIALNKTPADFDFVVNYLHEKQESVDWISNKRLKYVFEDK